MKAILTIIAFLVLGQTMAQDLHIINLREGWFNSMQVTSTEKPLVAVFPEETVTKDRLCALEPARHCFDEGSWDVLVQQLEGKRVLILVHGMAKDWAIANKDFFNMYWAAKRNLESYDAIIGISWPGDSHIGPNSYLTANKLAKKSGTYMEPYFEEMANAAETIDIITHSMGAKVICWGLKGTEVKVNNLVMMAPSIFRNKLKPMRRWNELFDHVENRVIVAYSNQDFAFAWTSLQHVGMGYDGMNVRKAKKYPKLVQIDCTTTINQHVFMQLPRDAFRSRSNHSSYCQSDPVFRAIRGALALPPSEEALRLTLESQELQPASAQTVR